MALLWSIAGKLNFQMAIYHGKFIAKSCTAVRIDIPCIMRTATVSEVLHVQVVL